MTPICIYVCVRILFFTVWRKFFYICCVRWHFSASREENISKILNRKQKTRMIHSLFIVNNSG